MLALNFILELQSIYNFYNIIDCKSEKIKRRCHKKHKVKIHYSTPKPLEEIKCFQIKIITKYISKSLIAIQFQK